MPLRSTSDDRAKIIEMHEAHMPVPEIAKVTGFGESTIYNIIARERERRLKAEGDLLARSISVDRIIDEREGKKAAADMEQMIADYHAQNRPTKPAAPSAPEAEQTAPEAEQPQENPPEIAPEAEQPPETVSAPAAEPEPEPEPAAEQPPEAPAAEPEPEKQKQDIIVWTKPVVEAYMTDQIYLTVDTYDDKITIELRSDNSTGSITIETTDAPGELKQLAKHLVAICWQMTERKRGGRK